MSLFPYVGSSQISELSKSELYNVCYTLELEYRGGNTSLNKENIDNLVKGNPAKLNRFALHTNIVEPIINKENTTYINPPVRTFQTKSGGQVSKKLQDHINLLYSQMNFDLHMAKAEKYTSLLGMSLYKPTFDEDDNTMNLMELYPSNESLKLTPGKKFPNKISKITYTYKVEDIEHTVVVDKMTATDSWEDDEGEHKDIDYHNFGELPFAILKFKIDNTRAYGPPDFELYSLCKHRSLVLANAMARLHLSELEKMSVMGASLDQVKKGMKVRLLALEPVDDGTGNMILPKVEYLSPEGQDALNILEAYFKLYQHVMDNRGHVQKIFSRGADVPSAESIRLGSVDLFNKQQEKQKFLILYERELWSRIIKENNRYSQNPTIPEDTKLTVNFKPEALSFNSAKDEVIYFEAAIKLNVQTPISWLKNGQTELTNEEAEAQYEENKKINEELGINKKTEIVEDESPIDENNLISPEGGEDN